MSQYNTAEYLRYNQLVRERSQQYESLVAMVTRVYALTTGVIIVYLAWCLDGWWQLAAVPIGLLVWLASSAAIFYWLDELLITTPAKRAAYGQSSTSEKPDSG